MLTHVGSKVARATSFILFVSHGRFINARSLDRRKFLSSLVQQGNGLHVVALGGRIQEGRTIGNSSRAMCARIGEGNNDKIMARARFQHTVWAITLSGNNLCQVTITGGGRLSGDLLWVAHGRGVVAVLSQILAEARILASDGVLHKL